MTPDVGRLKRRPEFVHAASRGRRAALPGLVLQAVRNQENAPPRLGLTATRRIGGAVVRNRCRRRLRALARAMLAAHGAKGYDYVLVARGATAKRPWPLLVGDLEAALKYLKLWRDDTEGR